MSTKPADLSRGWEAVASELIHSRSQRAIGAATVRQWAAQLAPGATALDLGCGAGIPVTQVLVEQGCVVFGVEPAPTLARAWRERFPTGQIACEPVEHSAFFHRQFDAVTVIGLIFLLQADEQAQLIEKIGGALQPQGRLLFTAPTQEASWQDILTGMESRSLGEARYRELLAAVGLDVEATYRDEGESHYFAARRVR